MRMQVTRLAWWGAFVLAYVALDWASFLVPLHGLNITPWNPSLALGLVVWIRYGRIAAVPWFVALLIGEAVIRGLPASIPLTLGLSVVLVVGYGAIAEALRPLFAAGDALADRHRLLGWLTIVLAGTLLTSAAFISLLWFAGLIPVQDWTLATARYWVGDFVGVVVTMPFFWMLFEREGRARLKEVAARFETAAYGIATIGTLWVAFGLGGTGEFQYFYLLFLPLVWAAARQGMAGAAATAFALQAGIIVAARWLNLVAVTVIELQMLVAAIAFVGFFIGAVVDQMQRMSSELRQSLRLAAAGEMAAALAHELNQPLTALSTYAKASEILLANGDTGERLQEAIGGMVAESRRTAEVVTRLRDFFRTGATKLEPIALGELMASTAQAFAAQAGRLSVDLAVDATGDCQLLADRLHLEIVLRNLLSNAFDAVTERPLGARRIRISAEPLDARRVRIRVEDNGPGLTQAMVGQVFEVFHSTKTTGLGLGLAISRAIVEAHGGSLRAEAGERGLFTLVLPLHTNADHAT